MKAEATRRMTREVVMLLDLAIARSRCSIHADEESKKVVRRALEATKQEIAQLEELAAVSERDVEARGKEIYAC